MEEILPAELIENDRNAGGHPWQMRRRLMWIVVAFSMACISWAVYQDTDSVVHQTVVTMGFGTLISVTGTYVFGATWSDKVTK